MSQSGIELARRAAKQLATEEGFGLIADVELAIAASRDSQRKYADVVGIAGLVVSLASLAWDIYNEQKSTGTQVSVEALELALRSRSEGSGEPSVEERRVIKVLVRLLIKRE